MTCGYCQFSNCEEDHRCRRCGRRLTGVAIAAPLKQSMEPVRVEVRTQGANALSLASVAEAPSSSPIAKQRTGVPAPEISMDAAATLDGLPRPRSPRGAQPSLFGAELQPKIIPFQPHNVVPAFAGDHGSEQVRPISVSPGRKPAARPPRKVLSHEDPQATLDFLPPVKTAARTLKTSAEAVIYCDAVVAAPLHRATAAALDFGMILLAFGSVLFVFQTVGKPEAFGRATILMLGAMAALTALLYGLLFASFGAVTPGMKWTHLRLVTFDGFALDGRARTLRFLGSWMSVLSGGIGLLWALLDEENLTWHDHLSKTFPTLRESDSTVVRQSRRDTR